MFLNKWVSIHFWVAGTYFWVAKTCVSYSTKNAITGSPNCVLFCFMGHQLLNVDNHCSRIHPVLMKYPLYMKVPCVCVDPECFFQFFYEIGDWKVSENSFFNDRAIVLLLRKYVFLSNLLLLTFVFFRSKTFGNFILFNLSLS